MSNLKFERVHHGNQAWQGGNKRLVGFLLLGSLTTVALVGCAGQGTASTASKICESRFDLVDQNPNIQSGADKWMESWRLSLEIQSSEDATDNERAVARSMDAFFQEAAAADLADTWPIVGEAFATAGFALNDACSALE
jgi:hypothetical protein